MIAVIGGAEPASIALHAACGFEEVGRTPVRRAGSTAAGSTMSTCRWRWGRARAMPPQPDLAEGWKPCLLGKAKGGQGLLCRPAELLQKTRVPALLRHCFTARGLSACPKQMVTGIISF
jgi:hypothetical protein